MTFLAAFAGAAVIALAITPLAVRLAWAIGWLDHPEARKLHTSATPLLGGVVVMVAALAGLGVARLAAPGADEPRLGMIAAGAVVALALGLWDDRFGMQPPIKLAGQAAAAALLLGAGAAPDIGLPAPIEFALALVAILALMNAINFLDNMNGMVGGIAAITLTAFAWHSARSGHPGLATAQLALAGACAGWLPHNFPRAAIFLGDAGSLLLGYSLAASALLAMDSAPPGWARLGPAIMLGYPAFDMIFVVVNRLREGRRVDVGGKDHTNHRIASVLRCPIRTVLSLWFSTAALCASGLVVIHLNRPAPALLLSGLWTGLFLLSGRRLSSVPVSHPRPR